jgi:hypothetical protein
LNHFYSRRKIMSNLDKMTANEQLFTALTPEEGSALSGGGWLGGAVDWVTDKATDVASYGAGSVGAVVGGTSGAVVGAVGGALGFDTDIVKGAKAGGKGGYGVGREIV